MSAIQIVKHAEFASHLLNEQGLSRAHLIRDIFDGLLTQLEEICAPGRELSIAKTKLEEACFFAKKAMAINLTNQKQS